MERHAATRLAIFLPGLYGGGAERTMLHLAGGIAERGYTVDLVLAKAEGPYLREVPETVRVVDLEARRSLASLPALVRYLRRERPRAMLAALSRANLLALWARRLTGIPERVVVNEQNTLSKWARAYPDWRRHITPSLARYFYRWADCVVAVSHGVADDLVRTVGVPERKIKVIYNPGITPGLRDKVRAEVDHPWFVRGQPPVLLAVGRLAKQKDYGTLLTAFAKIRKTHSVRLLILGEGSERRTLEERVRELDVEQHVALPGFVDNPYAYMARSAAFVLSSVWEGLPTVLMEALYCGVPIVATDCPSGPREILKDGQLGRLVPMRDPDLLAEAIVSVLNGQAPEPSADACRPFTLDFVVGQYIDTLLQE